MPLDNEEIVALAPETIELLRELQDTIAHVVAGGKLSKAERKALRRRIWALSARFTLEALD